MDTNIQTYPCPCGKTCLVGKYLACTAPNCGFYSFFDELKWCKCGRGYCRNTFVKREKYRCCTVKGRNACSFLQSVKKNQSATSSQSSMGATPDHPTPSHSSTGTPPTTPCHFDSSTPTHTEENLSEALVMSQGAIGTLVDIIKDLVKLSLKDEENVIQKYKRKQ